MGGSRTTNGYPTMFPDRRHGRRWTSAAADSAESHPRVQDEARHASRNVLYCTHWRSHDDSRNAMVDEDEPGHQLADQNSKISVAQSPTPYATADPGAKTHSGVKSYSRVKSHFGVKSDSRVKSQPRVNKDS